MAIEIPHRCDVLRVSGSDCASVLLEANRRQNGEPKTHLFDWVGYTSSAPLWELSAVWLDSFLQAEASSVSVTDLKKALVLNAKRSAVSPGP